MEDEAGYKWITTYLPIIFGLSILIVIYCATDIWTLLRKIDCSSSSDYS